MNICPNCGAVVQGIDVIFHKCPPNTEIGESSYVAAKRWWIKLTIISILLWLGDLILYSFIVSSIGSVLSISIIITPLLLIPISWVLMMNGFEDMALTLAPVQILISMVPLVLLFMFIFLY